MKPARKKVDAFTEFQHLARKVVDSESEKYRPPSRWLTSGFPRATRPLPRDLSGAPEYREGNGMIEEDE